MAIVATGDTFTLGYFSGSVGKTMIVIPMKFDEVQENRGLAAGNYDKVQDSGTREDFDSGSQRDTRKGKGRYDLISPIAMRRLAVHLENGADKYDARNWEKGQPVSRYLDSAFRHMYNYLGGSRDEDHLSAALWNIHCMIHTEEKITRGELPEELNDLPVQNISKDTP